MKKKVNVKRRISVLYAIFLLGVGAAVAFPMLGMEPGPLRSCIAVLILIIPFAAIAATIVLRRGDKRAAGSGGRKQDAADS